MFVRTCLSVRITIQYLYNIIRLAQLSNLIGPFVPRDRPEKNDMGRLHRYPIIMGYLWAARCDPETAVVLNKMMKSGVC